MRQSLKKNAPKRKPKNKSVSSENENKMSWADFYRDNGITFNPKTEKHCMAYAIYYCEKAKLDRTKFPFERNRKWSDDIYPDRYMCEDAIKKIDRADLFMYPRTVFIRQSELNEIKKQLNYKEPKKKTIKSKNNVASSKTISNKTTTRSRTK